MADKGKLVLPPLRPFRAKVKLTENYPGQKERSDFGKAERKALSPRK
jgi:hypothetical protein